jgi:hypothetical protein
VDFCYISNVLQNLQEYYNYNTAILKIIWCLSFSTMLGRSMAQAVSDWLLMRAWVHTQVSPVGFVWTEWHWDRLFSEIFSIPLSRSLYHCFMRASCIRIQANQWTEIYFVEFYSWSIVLLIVGWFLYDFVCPDRSKFNFGMAIERRLPRYGYNFTFSHNTIDLHAPGIIWTARR